MNGHYLFLLRAHNASFLNPAYESFCGHLEIMGIDRGLIIAGSQKGSLITEVGYICSTEARSERGKPFSVVVPALAIL